MIQGGWRTDGPRWCYRSAVTYVILAVVSPSVGSSTTWWVTLDSRIGHGQMIHDFNDLDAARAWAEARIIESELAA